MAHPCFQQEKSISMLKTKYRYLLLIILIALPFAFWVHLKWFYYSLGDPKELSDLQVQIRKNLDQWLKDGALVRDDGYIYTVDTAQLAIYAANEKDQELYQKLLPILSSTIIDIPGQEFSQGMVSWRIPKDYLDHPDFKRDASGTTEALRVAEALWLGKIAFALPHDDLVKKMILAYQKHQAVDQNQWFIRNYYNIQTNAFAPNSYAVDYDPDFLLRLSQETTDAELKNIALTLSQKSAELLENSISPSGLVHQVMLPEIKTLIPTINMIAFSPNAIEMINNALTVAERCVHTCPKVIKQAQKFLDKQNDRFGRAYQAISGESLSKEGAGIVEYAAITRFACYTDDQALLNKSLGHLVLHIKTFLKWPDHGVKIYVASETLMSLSCLQKKYPNKI
jgi:hypothetical protein